MRRDRMLYFISGKKTAKFKRKIYTKTIQLKLLVLIWIVLSDVLFYLRWFVIERTFLLTFLICCRFVARSAVLLGSRNTIVTVSYVGCLAASCCRYRSIWLLPSWPFFFPSLAVGLFLILIFSSMKIAFGCAAFLILLREPPQKRWKCRLKKTKCH